MPPSVILFEVAFLFLSLRVGSEGAEESMPGSMQRLGAE